MEISIMLQSVRSALVCVAMLGLLVPVLSAQDGGTKQDPEQVVWVMTYSGGGG